MSDPYEFFGGVLHGDLWELCIGEKLGEGMSRHVYVWEPDPTLVVKIETEKHHWYNIEEFNTWNVIEHTKHARWFAPVVAIAGGGSMLLQRRTQPLRRDELPAKLPTFLTDTKSTNFGLLNGQVVCHDYGIHMLRERGMSSRMINADWWDLEEK